MKRRTFLLALAAVPAVSVAGIGEYKTPVGDEPIELFIAADGWVECDFDELCPGDMIRRRREPRQLYKVKGFPTTSDFISGKILVTAL